MNEFQQAMRRRINLERVARVTCDVFYLCANFSLPGHLCSRIGHDVRDYATDRQTSDTHDCLMPPTLMAGHNNESSKTCYHWYQKCVCPCRETTYFPHKTILYAQNATKVERKFLYGVVSIVRDLGNLSRL